MLRSLELFGFKSFADKTVFEFSAGITGVVGPNGSGKSNVVDAIKWILGDQSAKSLRGKEMTDVIFSGSSSRGESQFAEATLVFDNRSRFLPTDLDEVSVGRRLWQSGDSEYLINRNTARLKDVRDLFSGTGAGSSAYCIIEHGRVDQILQSNAANRRLIFEEAAGIARFRSRKAEAVRRLDRVEQNLLRLTDIVDEVESQVGAVRSQAQRATRFREVSTELETLWVGMVCDDYRRQTTVQDDLAARKEAAAQTVEEMKQRREQAVHLSSEAETALNAIDDEIRTFEAERADLRSRIASLETTLRHQATRESELESDLKRLDRQLSVMDGRVTEAEQEEKHLNRVFEIEREKLEESRAKQNATGQQLAELQAGLDESQQAIEETREKVLGQVHENSALSSRIGALRSEEEALNRRLKDLETTRRQQFDECKLLCEKLGQLNAEQAETATGLLDAQNTADEVLASRNSISDQQLASRESLADLREQRSAATARRSVLEDLEDRQEGFGIGVREILNRAEESSQSPWNLIRGSVADLLDVDMEHAALVEVALSSRAQLLVIDHMKPLVDYLATGRCRITGRVGFVSLEAAGPMSASTEVPDAVAEKAIEPTEEVDPLLQLPDFDTAWLDDIGTGALTEEFAPELNVTWVDGKSETSVRQSVFSPTATPSLTGQPGVIGRADSLVRSPRHLPHLAALLLADTWVVESLADAVRIVEESNGTVRAITPQGELVEQDGTLHAGMVRSETAVVSRKSELRRLKNELHRAAHLIAERELQLQHLAGAFESTDSNLEAARQAVADAAERCRTTDQDKAETQQSVTFAEQRIERLQTQLEQIQKDAEELAARRITTGEEHETGTARFKELQNNLLEYEKTLTERQHQLEHLEQGRTEFNLELTRMEERALSVKEATERLRDDLEQRRLQQAEAVRRMNVGQVRVQDLTLSKLNVRAELAELYVAEDQIADQVAEHASAQGLLRTKRQEASQLESKAHEQCREHEQLFHEMQMKSSGIEHQLQTSAERIQDEFQIDINDAVQQGRSALPVWLNRLNETEAAKKVDSDEDKAPVPVAALTIESPEVSAILQDAHQYDELRPEIEQRVDRLRRQLKKIGNVSTESLDNLTELENPIERRCTHNLATSKQHATLCVTWFADSTPNAAECSWNRSTASKGIFENCFAVCLVVEKRTSFSKIRKTYWIARSMWSLDHQGKSFAVFLC